MNSSDCVLAGIPRDSDSSLVSTSSSPREPSLQNHTKSDKLSASFSPQQAWGLGVVHNIISDSQKLKNDDKDSLKNLHNSFKKWLISEETLFPSLKLNGTSKRNMARSRNGNQSRSRSLSPSPIMVTSDQRSLETDNFKAQGKVSTTMIPDSQKLLRIDLDCLKSQLQAQTKAFEFLNHSVTLLEKESSHQRVKIQELEDVMSLSCCPVQDDLIRRGAELGQQELWRALARGLQEVKENLRGSEEVQRGRTTRSLQQLGQEIRESKKFLWEELEMLQEEVTYIHQKLKSQEEEITKNLVNIKKMQKNQVKCRKVLTKMKQQGGMVPEGDVEAKDWWGEEELEEELNDIWSAVNTLQNDIESLSLTRVRHRGAHKNPKGHRFVSPPPISWATDSESEANQPNNP